jgi:hypothetical protein
VAVELRKVCFDEYERVSAAATHAEGTGFSFRLETGYLAKRESYFFSVALGQQQGSTVRATAILCYTTSS